MNRIFNFLKATYYFFVGDSVILTGVVIVLAIVALLLHVLDASFSLALGVLLFLGVVATLAVSVRREIEP